ncbi:DinB family protein [Phytohalomonas tamaricis]|uniref:DinB family protein n=1 Tax=Phytohalomonas tamaricis TaxID=2081032 RepID=UPI000D0AF6B4|nr:DinB family protein [Phytohalomonas tamaricis]
MMGSFGLMAHNNLWSNYRLLNACAALSQEEFEAERTSFFPSLMATLNHILIVDWFYLDALEAGGKGPAVYANDIPCRTVEELRVAQPQSDERLVDLCVSLKAERLASHVTLLRESGARQVERIERVLLHLFMHQIHHRGQVHAMLAGTRIAPPQLDEFFLESDAALCADDLAALSISARDG